MVTANQTPWAAFKFDIHRDIIFWFCANDKKHTTQSNKQITVLVNKKMYVLYWGCIFKILGSASEKEKVD